MSQIAGGRPRPPRPPRRDEHNGISSVYSSTPPSASTSTTLSAAAAAAALKAQRFTQAASSPSPPLRPTFSPPTKQQPRPHPFRVPERQASSGMLPKIRNMKPLPPTPTPLGHSSSSTSLSLSSPSSSPSSSPLPSPISIVSSNPSSPIHSPSKIYSSSPLTTSYFYKVMLVLRTPNHNVDNEGFSAAKTIRTEPHKTIGEVILHFVAAFASLRIDTRVPPGFSEQDGWNLCCKRSDINLSTEADTHRNSRRRSASMHALSSAESSRFQLAWDEQPGEVTMIVLDKKETLSFYGLQSGSTLCLVQSVVIKEEPEDPVAIRERLDQHRKDLANEIFSTEQSYVISLQEVIEVFVKPLRKRPDLLTNKNITTMFAQLEIIYRFHKALLRQFDERIAGWSVDKSKIGDFFLKIADSLRMYDEYCFNYERNMYEFTLALQEVENLRLFVERTRFSLKLQNPESYLIMPIQRIPRYRMLLEGLLKASAETHVDYEDLKNAVQKIEEVASYINGYRREEAMKIYEIETRIVDYPGQLSDIPVRRFIREGPLWKISRGKTQQRWFFLFHDMLVYTLMPKNNVFQWKGTIQIIEKGIWVRLLKDTPTFKNLFQVVASKKAYTLYAESHEEKLSWAESIADQIDDFFEKFPHLRGEKNKPKIRRANPFGPTVKVEFKEYVEEGDEFLEEDSHSLIPSHVSSSSDLIRISDPETRTATDGEKFTSYLVTTSAQWKGTEFSVRRRYNDFVWLKSQLKKKLREQHKTTGLSKEGIAHLPGDTLSSVLTGSGRFDRSFVEARRVALENFLNSVISHSVFKTEPFLLKFLRDQEFRG